MGESPVPDFKQTASFVDVLLKPNFNENIDVYETTASSSMLPILTAGKFEEAQGTAAYNGSFEELSNVTATPNPFYFYKVCNFNFFFENFK